MEKKQCEPKIIFKHSNYTSMEYCEVISQDVPYQVCAELCKRKIKCAMKWKRKK